MKRHRSRRQNPVQKLNLVALMDIFTILVFFLMVNSSDVQIKDTHDSVSLPKSSTTQLPEDTLKLYITSNYMFFDGTTQKMDIDIDTESSIYPQLVAALVTVAQNQGEIPESRLEKGRAITILGDQNTSYTTIQKILASCAQTEFRDVSLAVIYNDAQDTASTLNQGANRQEWPITIAGRQATTASR